MLVDNNSKNKNTGEMNDKEENCRKELKIWFLRFLPEKKRKEIKGEIYWKITHVITLASSIKSSSDMVPSFIILTATSMDPRHVPLRTTPNWPEPSSSNKCSSAGSISHLSVMENRRFSSFTFYRARLLLYNIYIGS